MIISQRELLERITRNIIVDGKEFVNPEFIEAKDSLIVFVGNRAFKIIKKEKGKDYSDSQSRCAWLHEEMRINSEITPNFYFGVRPIFIHHDQIIVDNGNDDPGSVVEYALCMKRLKQISLVRNMLRSDTYSSKHSIIIARKIVDFHLSKLSGKFSQDDQILMQQFCSFDALNEVVEKDFQAFEEQKTSFIPAAVTELKYQRIKRYISKFLKENKDLLKERVSKGYVVPIHGALHSANIFVEDGSVYTIDRALTRRFRVSDIIKDPVYLSMDLERFGFKEEMKTFLNAYRERVKDSRFEKLLPFYMCRLAFVEGMRSFSLDSPSRVKPYFDLADKYARS